MDHSIAVISDYDQAYQANLSMDQKMIEESRDYLETDNRGIPWNEPPQLKNSTVIRNKLRDKILNKN